MTMFNTCPRCHSEISSGRQLKTPVICDWCGYVATVTERLQEKKLESSLTTAVCVASIVLVLLFAHILSWGVYSFEIPALQVMKITGLVSVPTLERYAEICQSLGKYDCVEDTYTQLGAIDSSYFQKLGIFQYERKEYKQAASTLQTYLSKGGKDIEAEYHYARTLSQLGEVDEAAKYFDYVLAARPDVIQTTVIQNYVQMLIDRGRLDQANQVIQSYRKRKIVADNFMEKELEEIHKRMGRG